MAAVERFKQEPMYGLSAKKVVVVERWPSVIFVGEGTSVHRLMFYSLSVKKC